MAGIGRLVAFTGMITIAASGLALVLQTSVLALQLWLTPVAAAQDSTEPRGM